MGFIVAHLDDIGPIAILLVSSLLIRSAVVFTGQNWIKTFSHTMTLMLLPVITYALTSVISGNIALSLGMVGALSIVRFRNPVKSPLELVIYFLMISSGNAAAVNNLWLILLVGTAAAVLFRSELANRLSWRYRGKPIYVTSFTEGNSLNTLEVYSDVELNEFLDHSNLISFVKSPEGTVCRFASPSREQLLDLSAALDHRADVTRVAFSGS